MAVLAMQTFIEKNLTRFWVILNRVLHLNTRIYTPKGLKSKPYILMLQ